MPVDNVRAVAWEALNDVLLKRAYADLIAKARFKALEPRDSRFARKLLYQTLDKLIAIDSAILPWIDLKQTPEKVLNALRLGVCQLFYFDTVPDFAVLDSTVEIIKQDGFMTRAGLVNAVLRNVIKEGKQPRVPDRNVDLAGHLSVKYSWPRFIVEMWLKERPEHAEALLAWEPRFHATARANMLAGGSDEELEEYLKTTGIEYERGSLMPGAIRLRGSSDITRWELFKSGRIAVQGEASQFVSDIAAKAAGAGASILDACAAPGGKSAYIAAALGGECSISAWDVHPHRVEKMKETFERLHVSVAAGEIHDARFADQRRFDFALVDAPCSGLGVAWGSPDIKVSRRPEDIPPLTVTQKKILSNAAKSVNIGGKLLYSTCTICRAENESIISGFLKLEREFKPANLAEYLPDSLKGRVENGCMLQLLPPLDGCEGFFLALMQRVK
jgi:16S rRNA (cytosine967-C5)-methyltransferase